MEHSNGHGGFLASVALALPAETIFYNPAGVPVRVNHVS